MLESSPWVVRGHAYPHATVRLWFRRVRRWRGEPRPREGQALAWRPAGAIDVAPLLPASIAPIGWLRLPSTCAISCAHELGVEAFERALHRALDARADAAAHGPLLLQLREPGLPAGEFERLFGRLRALRERRPLRLVVSSRHPESFARAVDGVHLTARDLAAARERPRVRWVGASCHAGAELPRPTRSAATSRCSGRCGPPRATRVRRGSASTASRARSRRRRSRSMRSAGSTPRTSPGPRRPVRTASRRCAPPGADARRLSRAAARGAAASRPVLGIGRVARDHVAVGRHWPRSISLQRSEQNGRQRLAGENSALRLQTGQSTIAVIAVRRGRACPATGCRARARTRRCLSYGFGRMSPPCDVKRIQSMYLFAEISGIRAARRVDADLEHLVDLAAERLLVAALLRGDHRTLRGLAQQPQHDHQRVAQRPERRGPAGDVAQPRFGRRFSHAW